MKSSAKLGLLGLTMINVAAIASLRSLPMMSGYGLASVAYFLAVALIFFIPSALISAELATGWPKKGGVFIWVYEAWGERLGFLAIWLQWAQNVIWYPMVLSFGAATFAYAFSAEMVHDKFFTLCVVLAAYWVGTLSNVFGMKYAGLISSIAVILGTILPALLIIGFGVWWLAIGDPSQIPLTKKALIPHPKGLSSLVLAAGVLVTFVGMEMSASHASDTKDPEKNYPRAIFMSASVILLFSILGTIVVGVILPRGELNLVSGLIEAFHLYLRAYGFHHTLPFIACAIALGVFGQASAWIAGPSKGLLAVAEHGYLPKQLRAVNKYGVQMPILWIQGAIVTVLSFIFLFLPSIDIAYWMLSMLCANLYLVMYILMFSAAIRLRYTQPDVKRAYKIPGGLLGMWTIGGAGIAGALAVIFISYIPPSQFTSLSPTFYKSFLAIGLGVLCIPPFILVSMKEKFK